MQKQYEQKKVSTALIQGLGGLFFIVLFSIIVLGLIKKGFRSSRKWEFTKSSVLFSKELMSASYSFNMSSNVSSFNTLPT